MKMRKLLTGLAAMLLATAVIPMTAFADDESTVYMDELMSEDGDTVVWHYNDSTTSLQNLQSTIVSSTQSSFTLNCSGNYKASFRVYVYNSQSAAENAINQITSCSDSSPTVGENTEYIATAKLSTTVKTGTITVSINNPGSYYYVLIDTANKCIAAPQKVDLKESSVSIKNAKATPTSHTITLSWDNCADATSYKIYDVRNSGRLIATLAANTTTYVIKNLDNGSSYEYEITAVDKSGLESARAKVNAIPVSPFGSNAPRSCNSSINGNNITINWSFSAEIVPAYFVVYDATTSTKIAQTSGNTTSVSFDATDYRANYFKYYVVAYTNDNQDSEKSTEYSVSVPGSAPTGLKVTDITDYSFKVSWDAYTNTNLPLDYYVIQIKNGSNALYNNTVRTSSVEIYDTSVTFNFSDFQGLSNLDSFDVYLSASFATPAGINFSVGTEQAKFSVARSTTLSINTQPSNTMTIPTGDASFTVNASSTHGTITYQWKKSTDGSNWTNIGTNSATLSLSDLKLTDNNTKFKCVLYDGKTTKETNAVNLSVLEPRENMRAANITIENCRKYIAYMLGKYNSDIFEISKYEKEVVDKVITGDNLTY